MTHRELADRYRRRFLATADATEKAIWRRLQMKHVSLAAAAERAEVGLPARDDTARTVWKAPCLKGCTVNCGRCALGAGQKERP